MDRRKIGENISRYFGDSHHSDVIFFCDGEEIKAHRVILASGSAYFKKMLEGDFAESHTNPIPMHSDSSAAFEGLVAHLYGLRFDRDLEDATNMHANTETYDKAVNGLLYLIDLYITAAKYLVPSLTAEVLEGFTARLEPVGKAEAYPQGLDTIARYVYLTRADEATALREVVVLQILRHTDKMKDSPNFKRLLKDVPELSFDLLTSLEAENESLKVEKTVLDIELKMLKSRGITGGW